MAAKTSSQRQPMVFETIKVNREEAVLFAEIASPPLNLLGPALVRDLVSLIQRAESDIDVQGITLLDNHLHTRMHFD